MRIPEYIKKKLDLRCEYAKRVNSLDFEIHEWMKSKGIEISCYDYENELLLPNTIILITEPDTLKNRTIKYIESKRNEDISQMLAPEWFAVLLENSEE